MLLVGSFYQPVLEATGHRIALPRSTTKPRGLTLADTDKRFNDARRARNHYVRLQHSLRR